MGMIPEDIAVDVEKKRPDGGRGEGRGWDLRQDHGGSHENGEIGAKLKKRGSDLWKR